MPRIFIPNCLEAKKRTTALQIGFQLSNRDSVASIGLSRVKSGVHPVVLVSQRVTSSWMNSIILLAVLTQVVANLKIKIFVPRVRAIAIARINIDLRFFFLCSFIWTHDQFWFKLSSRRRHGCFPIRQCIVPVFWAVSQILKSGDGPRKYKVTLTTAK